MNQIPDKIRRRVRALDSLPSIPTVIQPLLSIMQLPADQIDISKIEELISRDKSIALQCLRMANSPLFARRPVENIGSAIMVLGLKRMQSILVSCSLNQFVPAEKCVLDPITYWRHSLGCALVARKLAQLIRYGEPEKAYVAGLLHDLGMLVSSLVCPEEFRACLHVAQNTRIPLHVAELHGMGFTHAHIGGLLAQQWNLPKDLEDAIRLHHFENGAGNIPELACLIHLSDLLCRVRGLGYGYYDVMRLDLSCDAAWGPLVKHYPAISEMDLMRFTLDLEGAMDEIAAMVDTVFKPHTRAAANHL